MTYFNKIKNCLVKLKVAQLEKKKILFLHKLHVPSKLLEVLYTGGLILGYIKSKFFYQVFLKYNSIGVGVLELLVLLNSKAFKAISLEPHAKYLVLSDRFGA